MMNLILKIFSIVFLLFVFHFSYSQDIRPERKNMNSFTRRYYNAIQHNGKILKLYKNKNFRITLRERTYSTDAIQSTFIFHYKRFEIRTYTYLNFPELSLTNALTLRYIL